MRIKEVNEQYVQTYILHTHTHRHPDAFTRLDTHIIVRMHACKSAS